MNQGTFHQFIKPKTKYWDELKAYCSSDRCRRVDGVLKRDSFSQYSLKSVCKSVSFCPDCGEALFWATKLPTQGSRKKEV